MFEIEFLMTYKVLKMYTMEFLFISKISRSMFAFNSSQPLTPYLEVVRAPGWFLLLSKGTASSFATALPTWKDWNADANSLTDTYRYGLSCCTQYCF